MVAAMKWTSNQRHRYNVRDILKYSQVSRRLLYFVVRYYLQQKYVLIIDPGYLISYFVYVLLHNIELLNIVDLERKVRRYQRGDQNPYIEDNTIAIRKKLQTIIYKTLYRKLKIEQHEPN